ncbi:MAG: AAA family ATPase [Solirubrobacteraceae bacterium]
MSDKRRSSGELFATDSPIPADQMIGRADDVERMAIALAGATNLVVAGPRRTGKTSACDAALELCAQEGCYVAAVDLFHKADAVQLAQDLALSVLANRTALRQAIERARGTPAKLAELLSMTVSLRARQDLGEDIEITWTASQSRSDPGRALLTALELPQRIAVADNKRLVLFIDEFQEIASGIFGDPDVLTRQLRAVLQRSPSVSVLFAGSMEHLMRDLFSRDERALSQFGSFYQLGPITNDEWSQGVTERLALDQCTITPTALDRLLTAGEGHPRTTMLIARESHAEAVHELLHELDDAIVRRGADRALAAERLRHEQLLARIRAVGRYGQLLAQRVALGAVLYDGIAPQTANRTLKSLQDLGVIAPGVRRGHWLVVDPLVGRYLRNLPVEGPVIVRKR